MAGAGIPMDWAALKRNQLRDRCMGYTFWSAGMVIVLVQALKHISGLMLSPMFAKTKLYQLGGDIVTSVLGIPGISPLWELDYFTAYAVMIGLFAIGA